MFSPPGAGKGTQKELLVKKYNLPSIVVGDLVRELGAKAETGDPLAIEAKERYDKGIPQPDNIIFKILRRKLESVDLEKGIIFDAFPLSLGQAQGFEKIIREFFLPRPIALYIEISEDEAVTRLGKRRVCPKCQRVFYPLSPNYSTGKCDVCGVDFVIRDDDKEEVVRERFRRYDERMRNLREYYQERRELIVINGEQTVEEVFKEIIQKLETYLQKNDNY